MPRQRRRDDTQARLAFVAVLSFGLMWLLSNSAPSHKLAALSGILLVSTATAGISGPAIVAGTFLLAWLARDGLLPYGGFLSRFWDGCIISANGLLQTIRVPARIPALAAMSAALRTNAQPSFSVPGQPSHVNPGTATPATAPGPAPGPLFQVFLAIWAPIRSVFFGGEDVLYRPSPESFLRFNRNAVPYLIQWGIIALVIYRVFYRELESTLYEIKRQLRRALGMGRPAHPAPGSAGERAREVRREAEEAGRREQQMRAEEEAARGRRQAAREEMGGAPQSGSKGSRAKEEARKAFLAKLQEEHAKTAAEAARGE